MFENLVDLSFQRTGKQAFGFYLAYLFLFALISGICGGLFGAITGHSDFATGVRVGQITAIILCLSLAIVIVIQKKQMSFKVIVLVLLSGALAVFIGALGGLIPIAFLTKLGKNT